jgi:hypothetical protein
MNHSEMARRSFSVIKFLDVCIPLGVIAVAGVSFNLYEHAHKHQHISPIEVRLWLALGAGIYVLVLTRRFFGRLLVRSYDRSIIGNIARNNIGIPGKERDRFANIKAKYEKR